MKFHPDAVCPPGAPEPVRRAFAQRCSDAYPRLRALLRDDRLTDAEELALVDETWLRAWHAFPEMLAAESDDLAAGLPSPHHWTSWYCRIARRLKIDRLRQLKLIRRVRPSRARASLHATRAGHEPGDAPASPPPAALPRHTLTRVPLSPSLPASDEYDPVAHVERVEKYTLLREAFRSLSNQEQQALATSLRNLSDEASAAELGITRFSVYRLRRRAINRLRDVFRNHGYDVPTTIPTAWP